MEARFQEFYLRALSKPPKRRRMCKVIPVIWCLQRYHTNPVSKTGLCYMWLQQPISKAICYLIITFSGSNCSIRLVPSMKGIQRFEARQVESTWRGLALDSVIRTPILPAPDWVCYSPKWNRHLSCEHQNLISSCCELQWNSFQPSRTEVKAL